MGVFHNFVYIFTTNSFIQSNTDLRINTIEDNYMDRERIENIMPFIDPIISTWFMGKYSKMTEPQKKVIPLIHQSINVLVSSPTGTGKTLTGFLAILNELFLRARNNKLNDEIICVYISPLKALANDINKNLNTPLEEIYELAEKMNLNIPKIRVGVRTGDTEQKDRQKMLKKPPHILITTPESLSLALTAPKFKEKFTTVRYVIIDEIHEISSSKRGTLLSLNMERLEEIAHGYTRIGLSATQAPLPTIAAFLCGYEKGIQRKCEIIDVDIKRSLDLMTLTPVRDLTSAGFEVANERMYDILAKLIEDHKTTLIFTNTRSSTEHVAIRLKARGIDSLEAHHSSLGKETRINVEEKLKRGELRCVISSTSLELGIDIGSIDLVIQIGSPKSVSKGLQRIGRAGHSISELTLGRFVVFTLDDLVECAVLTRASYERDIDRVNIPEGALDVLSQAVVGMTLERVWNVEDAFNLIRRSYPYRNLKWEDYLAVVEYLAGRVENNTIYSKIWYDEEAKTMGKKKSTRMIYFMNVGTIPDDSDYKVVDTNGRHLGQLSDKFVERMVAGDIFVLGARTYAFIKTRGNRVMVRDATGMKPTIPSWSGELLPRSYDLGTLIGKFRETVAGMLNEETRLKDWLMENYRIDENGARSIISYIKAQSKFNIPTDRHLYVEGYEEEGLYSAVFLIPLGRRLNDALSRAYAQAIANTYLLNTRITVTDDGFMLTFEKKLDIKNIIELINTNNFTTYVKNSISNTTIFKERFRQCATRALMVLRKYKGHEVSIVIQQLRSDRVLKALENIHNFPVIMETYREIMNDMMDVPAALKYVSEIIERGNYSIADYSTKSSPFSLSLILASVSDIVLMEDRAKLLRELQSRIVDRVYGTEYMDFKIKDHRIVDLFYSSKVPRVSDEESMKELFEFFPYVDISRSRFNSPFPYGTEDSEKICRRLAVENKIESVYVRGIYWTLPERVELFRKLFSRHKELTEEDKIILAQCNGKSMKEIAHGLSYPEDAVKNSLNALESMYLIKRNFSGESTIYMIREEPEKGQMNETDLVYRTISSMGPMTADELSIKLPMEREILDREILSNVSMGRLDEDYVTPVFAKQYIEHGHIEQILSYSGNDPEIKRKGKIMRHFDNADQYLSNVGYFTDAASLEMRVPSGEDNIKNSPVIVGRFFRHRYTVMHRDMALALQKLRENEMKENDIRVYSYLEYGAATPEAISSALSIDIREIKLILKELQYSVLVYEENGRFGKIAQTSMSRNEAMETLLTFTGPVTQNELMRNFWFYIKKGDLDNIPSSMGKNGIYFGELPENYPEDILVPVRDPSSIYERQILSYDSGYNMIFYSGGRLSAFLSADIYPEMVWISQVELEKEEDREKLLKYIDTNFVKKGKAVVFNNNAGKIVNTLEILGYSHGNEFWVKGRDKFEVMYSDKFIENSLEYYGATSGKAGTARDNIMDATLGIREGTEARMWSIRTSDLESYFTSDLIFTFNGPLSIQSKGTMETIAIYRSLRPIVMTPLDQDVLRFILQFPASENEIIENVHGSHLQIEDSISRLWNSAVICKDAESKYRFVIEKFSRDESAEWIIAKVISTYGFINYEMYQQITGMSNESIYKRLMAEYVKKNELKEVFLPDTKKFFMVKPEFIGNWKTARREVLLSPRDLLYSIIKQLIKKNFGGTRKFIYAINGKVKLELTVKRNKNDLHADSIEGDMEYLHDVKKIMAASGLSIRDRSP